MNLAPAQRWANILLGGAVVALVGVLVFKGSSRPSGAGANTKTADAAQAATNDAGADADAPIADLTGSDAGGDPLLEAIGATTPDSRAQSGVGSHMPDGAPVPPLPANAPRTARFGVVLVTYAGAQGALANARSRQEAADLAKSIGEQAKTDFRAAVGRGDSGSSADVGRVPRGVLELAPEYALFTLPAGGVSEPVDTPRGFWIIQRIE